MGRPRPSRRQRTPDAESGAETRLVYSTGGTTPAAPPAPASPPAAAGTAPRAGGVRLRVERRASDRMVTIVTGLPGTPEQVEVLARELRALCGAGGTARGKEIELQGDQRERVTSALVARGMRVKTQGG